MTYQTANVGLTGITSRINNTQGTGLVPRDAGSNPYRTRITATHTHTLTLNSIGNNESHNNLMPYISIYIFRRTA